jgi:uncharacterized repeat protein (TIGR04052 family)
MGLNADSVELADLRLYVSNVALLDDEGNETPVELVQDGVWQVEDVALLDFEDKTAGCAESGTTETNAALRVMVPSRDYSGIRFDISVPFELNHGELSAAPSPLNVSTMFWAWQVGHKFARIDLLLDSGVRFNFHLGSTMCASASPSAPPGMECGRSNRARIALSGFDPLTQPIEIDVAELFAQASLGENVADTPPGCQSGPAEAGDCQPIFPRIGLDFETGACAGDCADQALFRAP